MRRTTIVVAGISLATGLALTACSSSTPANETPSGQAASPSQTGFTTTDADYNQLAFSVDNAQIELSQLAVAVKQQASDQVLAIARQANATLPDDIKAVRQLLIANNVPLTSEQNKADITQAQFTALHALTGSAFDQAWAQKMITLNNQVLSAATTEMNSGQDPQTRALARAKIDYASAQNGALKRITGN